MPIRVQNDLPVKEILEQENIFVMDEYRAAHQEDPSDQHRAFESDAAERGYGTADFTFPFQHAAAGGRHICANDQSCVKEHIHQSYL